MKLMTAIALVALSGVSIFAQTSSPLLPELENQYVQEELYIDENQSMTNKLWLGASYTNQYRFFVRNIAVERHTRSAVGIGYYNKGFDMEIDTLGLGYVYWDAGNGLELVASRDFIDAEKPFDQKIHDNNIAALQTIEIGENIFVVIADWSYFDDDNTRLRLRLNHKLSFDYHWSIENKYTYSTYQQWTPDYFSPEDNHVLQSILYFRPDNTRYKYGLGASYRQINKDEGNVGVIFAVRHIAKKRGMLAMVEVNKDSYLYLYLHWKF